MNLQRFLFVFAENFSNGYTSTEGSDRLLNMSVAHQVISLAFNLKGKVPLQSFRVCVEIKN